MTVPRKDDLVALTKEIQRELTRAKAELAEVQRAIASLPDDEDAAVFSCPHCGPLASVKSQRRLEEHLRNVHEEGLKPSRPPAKPKVETSLLDEVLPPPSVAESGD